MKTSNHSADSALDLILPGVFERLGDWAHKPASSLSFSSLERMLTLSNRSQTEAVAYESTLWSLFDPQYRPQDELAAGRQLSSVDSEQVCCADPVHLRLETNSVTLVDQSQFSMSDTERSEFAALINEYLVAVDGQYFFDTNGRGFLTLKESRSVLTTPLSQVTGNHIEPWMPHGEQQTFWLQMMNELQMLLHSASFNGARTKRGEPAINALWIWGAGQLQRLMEPQYRKVYCNDHFAEALARSVGIPVYAVPPKFDVSLIPDAGKHLVVLNDLLPHSQYDNYPGWHTAMERLCTDWFSPLLDAVRQKRLSRVALYPCDGVCYALEPGYHRRFWRRSKPLLSHLDDDNV